MSQNIKAITTKLPTYLEILLQEDNNIKLIFKEKKKAEEQLKHDDTIEHVLEEMSELELTGTPLQTDLGEGDDTVGIESSFERPPSWTAEEAQQYPLSLEEARSFINNELKMKRPFTSMYSICDGRDALHTLVLGTTVTPNKIDRTLVYVLPCYDENNEITTLDFMKKDHIKNVRKDARIEVLTTKSYNLFGCNLKNCHSLQSVEHNGNISVDLSINENIKTRQNNSSTKMNFQVILGHKESHVINFWSELSHIQSYIKELESVKQLNDSTVINPESNLDGEEIISVISNLVSTVTTSKKVSNQSLDLKNLRRLDILDKLWDILKNCRTLSDLRDCFHLFFEELALDNAKIHVLCEDKSSVAEIVNGILDGKIAVPTLSFSQSLELLIELGLEKLKKDYLVIVTSFYSISEEMISKKWNELSAENSINSHKSSQRRTRISINPKTPITDLTSNKLKLTFLDSLHKVTEFMFLYKDNLPLSEEGFDSFCETLCKKFIDKFPKVVQSCDFKKLRLCHFSFEISSSDANSLITDKVPVATTVKMFSSIEHAEVMTVFHFSDYRIFPPSVFEDYEICSGNDDVKNLYVTKLVKYVQLC